MSENAAREAVENELKRLEGRIGELVLTCERLREENHSLMDRLEGMMNERASLLQKNEQVRSRVEAMITRLKALEQGA